MALELRPVSVVGFLPVLHFSGSFWWSDPNHLVEGSVSPVNKPGDYKMAPSLPPDWAQYKTLESLTDDRLLSLQTVALMLRCFRCFDGNVQGWNANLTKQAAAGPQTLRAAGSLQQTLFYIQHIKGALNKPSLFSLTEGIEYTNWVERTTQFHTVYSVYMWRTLPHFHLINIVHFNILRLNFFSKTTLCPFNILWASVW